MWRASRVRGGDPDGIEVRTNTMAERLLTIEGTLDGTFSVEQAYDHAMVDLDGRLLVSMIDVLALVRLDGAAEIVLVHFDDGASRAFRVSEISDGTVYLQLSRAASSTTEIFDWTLRLWSRRSGSSAPIASIAAMTFASFVGQP
jgi:hypothetical protein